MFVDNGGTITFLPDCSAFFGWLSTRTSVQWGRGNDANGMLLLGKEEFVSYCRSSVPAYRQIEELPHEPAMADAYYAWRDIDYTPNGEHFDHLLSFFDNLETPQDALIVRSMFLSPLWGGLSGTRPAFIITSPDRGCGKSTFADVLGELYGAVRLEPDSRREERVVSRLLSPTAIVKRIVIVDNVKSEQGSPLIESLITSTEISGHQMYIGEAVRPNTLTFIITGNGIRLSRDLSERSFIISLTRPVLRPEWRDQVFGYVHQYRAEIIMDIRHCLRTAPKLLHRARDRWQSFLDGPLSAACPDAASLEAVVALTVVRRSETDIELEEADSIEFAARAYIEQNKPGLFNDVVFLTSNEMRKAINDSMGNAWNEKKVKNNIDGHVKSGRLTSIEWTRTKHARGYQVRMSGSSSAPVKTTPPPVPTPAVDTTEAEDEGDLF
jgi:hypothetical protein